MRRRFNRRPGKGGRIGKGIAGYQASLRLRKGQGRMRLCMNGKRDNAASFACLRALARSRRPGRYSYPHSVQVGEAEWRRKT